MFNFHDASGQIIVDQFTPADPGAWQLKGLYGAHDIALTIATNNA